VESFLEAMFRLDVTLCSSPGFALSVPGVHCLQACVALLQEVLSALRRLPYESHCPSAFVDLICDLVRNMLVENAKGRFLSLSPSLL
jgi:hypothetical protein